MDYVSSAGGDDACFLCDGHAADDDLGTHILWRGESAFILLNAFPYNTGHVMVAPNRHVADTDDLDPSERAGFMEATFLAKKVIDEAMKPQGFNIGMNLGVAAGAGVPGHLHMHVVPRWGGDTNFMTTVGATKVLPEMLAETDAKLRPLFEKSSR